MRERAFLVGMLLLGLGAATIHHLDWRAAHAADAAPIDSGSITITLPGSAAFSIAERASPVWCVTFGGMLHGQVGGATSLCRRCQKPLVPSGEWSSELRLEVRGVTRFDGCVYCLADAVSPVQTSSAAASR